MTITFVTNLVHHHQIPVADEFYKILGSDYHYISTEPLPDWLIKGGYDPTLDRDYIIRTYQSKEHLLEARRLIDESDVVIYGAAPLEWTLKRMKNNKVTFHYSERWLKKIDLHAISPKSLIVRYKYFYRFRHGRCYLLCASAFAAHDAHLYGCFPNRCFKWGYITAVDNSVEASPRMFPRKEPTPLMWCARFLAWKHPELPVLLAARLKKKGYSFVIDMFGSGEQLDKIKELIRKLDVNDCVYLCGNRPNAEILHEMRQHSIFLFTSDRNEGWGAVLNEAMSCGCVPVASNAIGSVPYLINDGENGLVFKTGSLDSLEKAVISLLENPEQVVEMSQKALSTMYNEWSPKQAVKNFIELSTNAFMGTLSEYNREDGPASWDRS